MPIVLVTGMSGAGKSAALVELERRGRRVVDTDDPGWCEEVPLPDGGSERLWVEPRVESLLAGHAEGALFLQGCVRNQVRFYDRFDAVVLLSAPLEVLLERVRTRETNDFGKSDAERARIVSDHAAVEPLLRAGATAEIDTRRPLHEVADVLEGIARRAPVEP